jgi:lipoprotein-anchoring transpeptidase ErfK/SrfK
MTAAALVTAALLTSPVLTACTPASAGTKPSAGAVAEAEPKLPAPVIEATVAEGATADYKTPVEVSVAGGRLDSVTLTSEGKELDAAPPAGELWTGPELAPLTTYTLSARAVAPDGQQTILQRTFTTAAPENELTTDITPWGDQVVGIGYPITVNLSHEVTGDAERAAVQEGLVVSADKEIGPASWAWISGKQLQYRPKDFWPPNTRVTIDVNLSGVRAGEDLWGAKNRQVTFSTGRSQVIKVDAQTHQVTVERNGKVLKTLPTSLGKPGKNSVTRSGIKVIMDRNKSYRMRSDTLQNHSGADYDVTVPYALRLTWSGEFFHGAPWNTQIGRANLSNGCYNLRVEDAKWLYDNVMIGDPVITTGTNRQMEEGNGLGGVWNVSWDRWTARSAA